MGRIVVDQVIEAPTEAVWDELRHLDRHVEWMADAESIRFHDARRQGVGTEFTCRTCIGPIRLDDEMHVTDWQEGRSMSVEHRGLVTGHGTLAVHAVGHDRTLVSWDETLHYPAWLGGRIGAPIGDRLLRTIWRANLRRLAGIVEGHTVPG